MAEHRLFFATDIHGSETCFRKFLNAGSTYQCDAIVLGGDITGKQLVPIVRHSDGWHISAGGATRVLDTDTGRDEAARVARASGGYPIYLTEEEEKRLVFDLEFRDAKFNEAITEVIRRWTELAEERLRPKGIECLINLGNDDHPDVAEPLRQSTWVWYGEDGVFTLAGCEVASWGWSNRTPWHSPREQDEDALERSILEAVRTVSDPERALFNIHCPPFDSGLDYAPAVTEDLRVKTDGGVPMTIPVGSTAVRRVLGEVQPLAALHGHVHDSRGTYKLGRTLCINPGSDYQYGILRGALLSIKNGKIKGWSLTNG